MARRFLVTGGAGYVGSHLVAALAERGDTVTVLDNLRTGHRRAVHPIAQLVVGDVGDKDCVDSLLSKGDWDAVFHFAALSQVGESMREPLRYLAENAGDGLRLIEACVRHRVPRFIISSTAAVYGTPEVVPILEDAALLPQSPYGESKLMIERGLHWAGSVHGLRFASLRYFNAAGADPSGQLGEDHRPETHLIPLVIDAALGRRPALEVYGGDYATPDGTCIRDYVHVADLAMAHLLALDFLDSGNIICNLGSGSGHSVLEVIATVERVIGRKVPYRVAARRPGDPARLVASSERARKSLGWRPQFGDLEAIVGTAARWREAHPDGYDDG